MKPGDKVRVKGLDGIGYVSATGSSMVCVALAGGFMVVPQECVEPCQVYDEAVALTVKAKQGGGT